MDPIPQIGRLTGLEELARGDAARPGDGVSGFADTLKEAVMAVNELQRESESAQLAFARNEDVDLHDVLIKVEEAEIAFKAMMEIRNKLVDAYKEIMRMGS